MRILMLAPQPFFEPRGTPFSVLGRLKALSALGHQVDLVTYHVGQDVAIPAVKIYRTPKIGFIKSVKIGPSITKIFLDVLILFKALQLLCRGRYDLIHTHEEVSLFGVVLSKLFKTPHLYDMHSSLAQQLSNFQCTDFRPFISLCEWLERKVVSSSDAVITICPALQDYVAQINGHVPQMMIENVASGLDPVDLSEARLQVFLESYPQVTGKKIVLYAGTFEPYQGIDLLVESASLVTERFNDVVFLMVGGKPSQVKHYQHCVEKLGMTSHFYFTGNRPPEEIPLFVKLAHVLVSPRTSGTNTPLKIYSYLRSGKPIVATDLYTHTQVLNPNIAVLTGTESRAFAEGILTLLENPQLAASMAEKARVEFDTKYSLETYIQKTEQVLDLALAK